MLIDAKLGFERVHQSTTPQGDGNLPLIVNSFVVFCSTIHYPARGRKRRGLVDSLGPPPSSSIHYPARGRKPLLCLYAPLSKMFINPLPRKGTETIPPRRDRPIIVVHQSTTPQGDGNVCCICSIWAQVWFINPLPRKGTETQFPLFRASIIFYGSSIHYPARGRKLFKTSIIPIFEGSSIHYPARGRKLENSYNATLLKMVHQSTTPQGDGNTFFLSHVPGRTWFINPLPRKGTETAWSAASSSSSCSSIHYPARGRKPVSSSVESSVRRSSIHYPARGRKQLKRMSDWLDCCLFTLRRRGCRIG